MNKAVVALLAMAASSAAFAKDYSLVGVYDCDGTQVSIAMNSKQVQRITVGSDVYHHGNDTVTAVNEKYGIMTGQSAHDDDGKTAMLIFNRNLINKRQAILKIVGGGTAVMCNLLGAKV